MWFKKKNEGLNTDKNALNSNEYEKIIRRCIDINSEIELTKTALKLLQTDVDNLRGKFNQRLKGIKTEEEEKEKKAESINTNEYLPFG